MDLWLNEMFSNLLQFLVDHLFWVWLIGMSLWGFLKNFVFDS